MKTYKDWMLEAAKVCDKARSSLGAGGGIGVAGAHLSEVEHSVCGPVIDWIEDEIRALAAQEDQPQEQSANDYDDAMTLVRAATKQSADDLHIRKFFDKYALGGKIAPSCLKCGQQKPFSIRHGELPDIGLCVDCSAPPADDLLRRFPMQRGPSIPWSLAEAIYAGYAAQFGTSQSLERLAERGGFSWAEVEVIYKDKRGKTAIDAHLSKES